MSLLTEMLDATTAVTADGPLRIERVLPPEPHHGPGTYEVRLELSRPMTCFEARALHGIRRGLLPVGRVLTVADTTVERVAAEAGALAAAVREAEREGAELEAQARRRAEDVDRADAAERARLRVLAERIHFP